jgi:hypothetical protein
VLLGSSSDGCADHAGESDHIERTADDDLRQCFERIQRQLRFRTRRLSDVDAVNSQLLFHQSPMPIDANGHDAFPSANAMQMALPILASPTSPWNRVTPARSCITRI